MPTNQQILIGYVIPGAIGLLLVLLAWRPWSSAAPRGHWAVPLSIAIGAAMVVVGFAHQHRPPGFPPQLAEDWLFWGAIAVLIIGLLDALLPLWPELRSILVVILGAAMCYLVIRRVADQWPPHRILTCIGGAGVAIAAASLVIERTSEKQPGCIVPLVLLICAAALAPWPLFRGSADFTYRAAALPTVLLPVIPIAWWSKKLTLSRGGAMAFAIFYGATIVLAKGRISDVPPWQAIVLAAAPVVALVPLWTPLTGWKRPVVSLAVAVAMVLTVLIPSFVEWYKLQGQPESMWGG